MTSLVVSSVIVGCITADTPPTPHPFDASAADAGNQRDGDASPAVKPLTCEAFYAIEPGAVSYLHNPATGFTAVCQSVNFVSCLAFDERIEDWKTFSDQCPFASLYAVRRPDNSCCDSLAFQGPGFTSGKSGFYCCH